jgi:hypothetical protein
MARATWGETRDKAQGVNFGYFKVPLLIKSGESGARSVSLSGILDTSQDADARARSPAGTFPVLARLVVMRAELGWLPVVAEVLRVQETAKPQDEQAYCVVSVDSSGDLLIVELRAGTSNASQLF